MPTYLTDKTFPEGKNTLSPGDADGNITVGENDQQIVTDSFFRLCEEDPERAKAVYVNTVRLTAVSGDVFADASQREAHGLETVTEQSMTAAAADRVDDTMSYFKASPRAQRVRNEFPAVIETINAAREELGIEPLPEHVA